MEKTIKYIYKLFSPKYQKLFLDYKVDFKPRYGHGKPPHDKLYNIINAHRKDYADLLYDALSYAPQLSTIKSMVEETDANQPTWNNGFLPGLDIVGIYTMIATYRPQRYIEIGSGNSTKVAYKAKREHSAHTQIISIDPMPRAEIDHLADQVIRMPFEDADLGLVGLLDQNDILFVDNSHRIFPNSDATVFFLEILPGLKKGVIVHVHDVYLPYDYPQFMCDRYYSEQYGLAMYLLANPDKYRPILPNYFISEDPELSAILDPFWRQLPPIGVERHGGSFWLRIEK